jgi:hypothetical protein
MYTPPSLKRELASGAFTSSGNNRIFGNTAPGSAPTVVTQYGFSQAGRLMCPAAAGRDGIGDAQ